MIQDISPHKFHNEYRADAVPGLQSPVLCFDGRKVLIKEAEFPVFSQLQDKINAEDIVYAFAVDELEFFLYIRGLSGADKDNACEKLTLPEGFEYIDIRHLRLSASNVRGMILFTGYHLHSWYTDSIFCGRCGGRNIHSPHERAVHCPSCSRNIYPRLMPAVIVGVTDGDRLLLTQYREGYGYYALVAGFAEIGETLEETVAREVMEETGLKVRNITYYKSQPWGIANDLLVGYYCEADGSAEIHMDENELKLARWMKRDEIVLQPDSYSLTNEMMKMFRDHGAFWKNSSHFFANTECEYYPCHEGIDELNCMFCYCPFYGRQSCPGTPEYIQTDHGTVKDCSACTFPHSRENYETVIKILGELG